MNNTLPTERLVRLVAFGLCLLVYAIVVALIFQTVENRPPRTVSVKAVKLSIAQIELQAAPAPAPRPEPEPETEPEVIPEEEADVALEDVVEEIVPKPIPQPEPLPESDAPVAQVTQEASAPSLLVDPNDVMGWTVEQVEKEKYYPAAAERFGLTGSFNLKIGIDANGTIRSAEITSERGHRILRQALERMLSRMIGRSYGNPIGEAMEFEVDFEFE